jgi:hypothetical protein
MSKLNSILLIEDDSITNFINERLLRKLEIADDIKTASNGLEAISIIQDSVLNQQSSPYFFRYQYACYGWLRILIII